MDYSLIKNHHHPSASRDGLDLSVNTYTVNNDSMSPHQNPDRLYTKYTTNNNTSPDPNPRLTPNHPHSDTDEPMDGRRSSTTPTGHQPMMLFANHPQPIDLPDTTKLKLKFSVDRILGKDTDSMTTLPNSHHRHGPSFGYELQPGTRDQCIDCNSSSGRDSAPVAGGCVESNPPSMYTMPFSVASMLGLSNNGKAVVRPMPVRYLQRSPAAHAQPVTSYMFPNSQYDLHSANSVARHSTALHKAHSSPTLDRRVLHPSSITIVDNSSGASSANNVKRKRSWSRAVFSQLQRKGLEIQFQIQKYITKPDRRKLAARLLLTDAQVKVWFQNRRMKWRHTRETKLNQDKASAEAASASAVSGCRDGNMIGVRMGDERVDGDDHMLKHETSSSSDEDEIDVVAE